MTGGPHAQNGWPEIMSPAVESKDRSEDFSTGGESSRAQSNMSGTTLANHTDAADSVAATITAREIPPSTGVSYAVAIYPYMAEQDDEFDVVV